MKWFYDREKDWAEEICVQVSRPSGKADETADMPGGYIEIPGKWAQKLEENGRTLYAGKGFGRSICIYTERQLERLLAYFTEENGADEKTMRILRHLILGSICETELTEGRIFLPEALLSYCGADERVVLARYERDKESFLAVRKKNKINYTKLSKYMSRILRHKPELIGISLDEHGWADVDALVEGIAKDREFDREILEEIVRTDEKQRYSFNQDRSKIRANHGHSVVVDLELQPAEPPEILWHGSAEKYEESIDRTGLKPGNRMYVHLSPDRETAEKVGRRHGDLVLYKVRSGEMYRQGFRFYQAVTGVWLTYMVPVEYLEKNV